MVVANLLGFGVGLLLAARAQLAHRLTLVVAVFAFAISAPLAAALATANVDALCVAPLGAALLAMRKGAWTSSGLLIGATLAIKPGFVALALAPLMLGSLRGTVIAGLTTAGLTLAAVPLIPEGGRFFTDVVPFLLGGDTAGVNYSLKGVLDSVPAVPSTVASLARVGALLLLVYVGFCARNLLRRDIAAVVVFLFCATCLISGYFLINYCVFVALGVGLADRLRTSLEWLVFGLATYLLLSADVLRSSTALLDAIGTARYVIAAILLLGLLVLLEGGRTERTSTLTAHAGPQYAGEG